MGDSTPTRRGSEFIVVVVACIFSGLLVGLAVKDGAASNPALVAGILGNCGVICTYIFCRSGCKIAEIKANAGG